MLHSPSGLNVAFQLEIYILCMVIGSVRRSEREFIDRFRSAVSRLSADDDWKTAEWAKVIG